MLLKHSNILKVLWKCSKRIINMFLKYINRMIKHVPSTQQQGYFQNTAQYNYNFLKYSKQDNSTCM
jgi:hypothetical protein